MKSPALLALSLLILNMHPLAGAEKMLATFKEADSSKNWTAVNDGVMGGVSIGGCERTENGTLLFKGTLSLENNGGFSSIRTKPSLMDLSAVDALSVKAKGDGRTYWVEFRVAGQMGASSYRADFPTKPGEWKETAIPLENFKLQAFGQFLPVKPINLAEVESVGFTLADKQAGPFELEIEFIKTLDGEVTAAAVKSGGSIVDVAKGWGKFKTLLAAAAAADLDKVLSGEGPFTIVAPVDEAFAKLPTGTVEELLKPENKSKLAGILKHHVIAGKVPLAKALESGSADTLQGTKITAKFENGRILIGAAQLLNADIPASNGIIHVIDEVLLPPDTGTKLLTAGPLIELAIQRGVPLFNQGNMAACVAIYEITCESLRSLPGISDTSRTTLAEALVALREETNDRSKAWILRNALDQVYARLPQDR